MACCRSLTFLRQNSYCHLLSVLQNFSYICKLCWTVERKLTSGLGYSIPTGWDPRYRGEKCTHSLFTLSGSLMVIAMREREREREWVRERETIPFQRSSTCSWQTNSSITIQISYFLLRLSLLHPSQFGFQNQQQTAAFSTSWSQGIADAGVLGE